MKKHQRKHNDAGFTLIEVMIALLVFAIGVLALARMQLAAVKGNATAEGITEAVVFGSDQIEQMLSWDYDDSRLDSSNDGDFTLADGSTITRDGYQADPDGRFDVYWDVTDDSPAADSKTIDIEVYWQWKGDQKTLSLTTAKAK